MTHADTDEPSAPPVVSAAADGETTIILPYAISNIVFFQQIPFILLFVTGLLGGLTLPEQRVALANAIMGLGAAFLLIIAWWLLWRWALHGRRWAITATYILYVPGVVMVGAGLLLPAANLGAALSTAGSGRSLEALAMIVVAGLCAVMLLMFLANLKEKGLWEFARLDGRCPQCRGWRFGRIRRPRTIRCANCGAVLKFVRHAD